MVILHGHAPYDNFERARLRCDEITEQLPGGIDAWPEHVCPHWNVVETSRAARDLAIYCQNSIKLYDLLYLRWLPRPPRSL